MLKKGVLIVIKIENSTNLLNYVTYGEPSKPTIVMIHGLTGNLHQLDYFSLEMMKEFHIVSVDLNGRGDSHLRKSNNSSINKHVDDILNLLHALTIEQPIIMGYSMGGYIAMILSEKFPVQSVILLDSFGTMSNHQNNIVEPSFVRLSQKFSSFTEYQNHMTTFYKGIGVNESKYLQLYLEHEAQAIDGEWKTKTNREIIESDWHSFWSIDIEKIAKSIRVPVFLVCCTENIGSNPPLFRMTDFRQTIENIANLTVKKVQENHYTLVMKNQRELVKEIEFFLKKL